MAALIKEGNRLEQRGGKPPHGPCKAPSPAKLAPSPISGLGRKAPSLLAILHGFPQPEGTRGLGGGSCVTHLKEGVRPWPLQDAWTPTARIPQPAVLKRPRLDIPGLRPRFSCCLGVLGVEVQESFLCKALLCSAWAEQPPSDYGFLALNPPSICWPSRLFLLKSRRAPAVGLTHTHPTPSLC